MCRHQIHSSDHEELDFIFIYFSFFLCVQNINSNHKCYCCLCLVRQNRVKTKKKSYFMPFIPCISRLWKCIMLKLINVRPRLCPKSTKNKPYNNPGCRVSSTYIPHNIYYEHSNTPRTALCGCWIPNQLWAVKPLILVKTKPRKLGREAHL